MSNCKYNFGESVPYFIAPSSNSNKFHFDTVAGRYVVLSFLGSTSIAPNFDRLQQTIILNRQLFDDRKICLFGISIDPADHSNGNLKQAIPGIRYFWDLSARISSNYGALDSDLLEQDLESKLAAYQGFTLFLDPELRVMTVVDYEDPDHDHKVSHLLQKLPSVDAHAETKLHAPILIVPRVFEPEFCQELIALYRDHGGEDSGFMREIKGKTTGVIDYSFKRRMDYVITDEKLMELIRHKIISRLIPQIYKAFQFQVTRMERYIICRYDGQTNDFFSPHRDNTTKGTAHRRFAVTINLNSEEYEGGNLRFPEFGSQIYRAPTGGAVVFSCSLLHEATPVTQGERFAFLPFLYDEEAAKIREANQKYLG